MPLNNSATYNQPDVCYLRNLYLPTYERRFCLLNLHFLCIVKSMIASYLVRLALQEPNLYLYFEFSPQIPFQNKKISMVIRFCVFLQTSLILPVVIPERWTELYTISVNHCSTSFLDLSHPRENSLAISPHCHEQLLNVHIFLSPISKLVVIFLQFCIFLFILIFSIDHISFPPFPGYMWICVLRIIYRQAQTSPVQ